MRALTRIVSIFVGFLLAACGTDGERDAAGDLSVNLTAVAPSGTTYRLRDAVFLVGTPDPIVVVAELSTEDDPDADALETQLAPGVYGVLLEEPWRLERVDPSGPVDVEATLLSNSLTLVTVNSGETVDVIYEFQVDGIIVSTDPGNIRVGITVIETCDCSGTGGFGTGCPESCPNLCEAVNCDDDPCADGSCNPETGECVYVPKPEGAICRDRGVCIEGQCSACISDSECDPSPSSCFVPTCLDDTCVLIAEPAGTVCTGGERCGPDGLCE